MSDSLRPHRWHSTRLPRPWDSRGKNTGVGCHFLLHIIINSMDTNLGFTISWNWLRFVSSELMMISDHLILCHPLFLLPSVFPSIRFFSYELALCIRWPKYWSYSFSISPFNEYSELISFRIDYSL